MDANTLSLEDYQKIFNASANQSFETLEKLVTSLHAYLGLGDISIQSGNKSRNELHAAISNIENHSIYKALKGKIHFGAAGRGVAAAQEDFSAFMALQTLSPFSLSSDDSQALNALWQSEAWKEVYQNWQADKAARAAGQPAAHYSEQWYADRAFLLNAVMSNNVLDRADSETLRSSQVPRDRAYVLEWTQGDGSTRTLIAENPARKPGQLPHHVISFARNNKGPSKPLLGGALDDRLYGGNGDDRMESGAGNDWLEGGAGEDTYVLGKTDTGVDTIYDNDGKDHLEYEGPNTDMIYGGAGDDWLWGASDDDQWQRHNGQSHQRGDWISGEAGSDRIYGSSAKDVLFGGAGSDDIKGGAGDDLILRDAQYSVASRVIAQSYAGAGTRSYSWNAATQEFQQARTDGAYAMNPVVVPNGRIHEWDWQAEPHGTGYRFTLGAGISFMQQQRVADDDNWPQTFFCHQPNMPFIAPISPFIGSWA